MMKKNRCRKNLPAMSAALLLGAFMLLNLTACGEKDNNAGEAQTQTNQADSFTQQETQSSQVTPEETDALGTYLQEQDTIMTQMMKDMDVAATGNASLDFLKGMIPHHQSAIEMAHSYLNNGGNHPKLSDLAESIIETQTEEIDQMNRLIQEIQDSNETDEEKEKGYLDAYNKMMGSHEHMNHGTSDAANIDQAFAQGMLMHHQMAVDMSQALLDHTDHEEVKNLAQSIIDAQEQEIQLMQEIIDSGK